MPKAKATVSALHRRARVGAGQLVALPLAIVLLALCSAEALVLGTSLCIMCTTIHICLIILFFFPPFFFLKVCAVDACSKEVNGRTLCAAHRPHKLCGFVGCKTNARSGGVCGKHGALGACKEAGCSTNARKKHGYCRKHSKEERPECATLDCTTPARDGKHFCARHGAHGICKTYACRRGDNGRGRGMCFVHDTILKVPCAVVGCSSNARLRGLCEKHGAYGTCTTARCSASARSGGLCSKHKAKKVCIWKRCRTPAVSNDRCSRHGGGNRKQCNVPGCSTLSVRRGFCTKHRNTTLVEAPPPTQVQDAFIALLAAAERSRTGGSSSAPSEEVAQPPTLHARMN